MTKSQENQLIHLKNAGLNLKEVRQVGKTIMIVTDHRVIFIGKRGKLEFKNI